MHKHMIKLTAALMLVACFVPPCASAEIVPAGARNGILQDHTAWSGTTVQNEQDMKSDSPDLGAEGANLVSEWVPVAIGTTLIVVFMKVAITAAARMIESSDEGGGKRGRGTSEGLFLYGIPIIGAYSSDLEWADILKHVAITLGVMIGFWAILGLVVGGVLSGLDSV